MHYFLMGHPPHRGWRHSPSWPPDGTQCVRLYLTSGSTTSPSSTAAVGHVGQQSQATVQAAASGAGQDCNCPNACKGELQAVPISGDQQQQEEEEHKRFSSPQLSHSQHNLAADPLPDIEEVEHSYNNAMQVGGLSQHKQSHRVRFRHEVHLQKPLKV